jgi:arylsulfatase A-like enzyme
VYSLLVVSFGLCVSGASIAAAAPPDEDQPPNIIYIVVDDLDVEYPALTWLDHYPRLKELLADEGTTFTHAFVSLSSCCPSRTTALRGQYAHNHQIYTVTPPRGGFPAVHERGLEQSTIATWLHDAGYRTVLLGKYLNKYPNPDEPSYIPPGWDEWYAPLYDKYRQYDYSMNENGRIVQYGRTADDYLQDVLSRHAVDFIRRSHAAPVRRPFFIYLAPLSPHSPAAAARRHAERFATETAPRPPSFNEADVSDKPGWLRNFPRLTDAEVEEIDAKYRQRLRSMLSIVDTVEALIAKLAETGELANTYIVFTSDNGFHMGQHRLPPGKFTAFEEDVRVPLIIRGPGVPKNAVRSQFVVNVDYAPTFAELAGARLPAFVDGRSLLPLLKPTPPEQWRDVVLLEFGRPPATIVPPPAGNDRIPAAIIGPLHRAKASPQQGIRTEDFVYIEYLGTGKRELYNLRADPYQLENLSDTAPVSLLRRLAERLDGLRACAGEACRAAELPPATP